jgi:hypothetical protein
MRLSSKKRKKKDISIRKLIIIRKIGGTSAWRAHCSQERNIAYQFIYFLNEIIFRKKKKKDISFRKLIIRKVAGTSAWRAHCSQEKNIAYQFIYFLNEITFEKKKEKGY